MGEHEHNRSSWKFGVWKDVACSGDRSESEPAMGCDPINGMETVTRVRKPTLSYMARTRSTNH